MQFRSHGMKFKLKKMEEIKFRVWDVKDKVIKDIMYLYRDEC